MKAELIASLIAQYGLPLVVGIIEKWQKEDPTNPSPAEWLALFDKHPTLTKTYDQIINS